MDHALRTISYIADIGNIVVLMARRRMPRSASQDCIETTPGAQEGKKQYKMICHVFESEDVSKRAGVMFPPSGLGPTGSEVSQETLYLVGILCTITTLPAEAVIFVTLLEFAETMDTALFRFVK